MASTFSKLKIELIGTGDQSGTWGATTNNNLGSSSTYRGLEQAIVGMATLVTGDFTTNSYTLPYTDSNDDQDFRCLVLDITATLTGAGTVIVPAIQKPYIVMNNSSGGFAVTVKVSGQTGISVPNGAKVLLYNNGTDVGTAVTYLTSLTLGSALGVASGGTGLTSGTSGGIPYFSSTSAIASSAALTANGVLIGGGAGAAPTSTTAGNSGQVLTSNGAGSAPTFQTLSAPTLTNNTRQAVTSSATTTIDLNSGNVIDLTMAANITTLSFSNVPASGTPILIQIIVKNASTGVFYSINWPSSVYWGTATTNLNVQSAPALASGANGVTVIALLTTDGGTKWRGWVESSIPGGNINTLYSWGLSTYGQLGDNQATTNRSSPVQVGGFNWIDSGSMNQSNFAISAAGVAYLIGGTVTSGQAGTIVGVVSRPVQINNATNWVSLACGSGFTLWINQDGDLFGTGLNQYGQLGDGDVVNRSSFTQIGGGQKWWKVAAGNLHTLALTTKGQLFGWGVNNFGQVGNSTSTNRSSPVQVGSLTSWTNIAAGENFSLGISDGRLFSWGNGYAGTRANGLGGVNSVNSPVQVGALTTWTDVTASTPRTTSTGRTAHGIAGGALFGWGVNASGQIGDNTTIARSSPVQVGALTTWASAFQSPFNCFAIKTDGTAWAWGANSDGRLGLDDTTSRSSPVQLGAATDWAKFSGIDSTLAMRTSSSVNPA